MRNGEGREQRREDSGPGDRALDDNPKPGHFRDSDPSLCSMQSPTHPLSQNCCELAGQGSYVMDKKTTAPRQEGLCSDCHSWPVAKVGGAEASLYH